MTDRRWRKWELAGLFLTLIFGNLLHFVYDWSGQNSVVAAFAAVNESTWEHMKLLFFPMLALVLFLFFKLCRMSKLDILHLSQNPGITLLLKNIFSYPLTIPCFIRILILVNVSLNRFTDTSLSVCPGMLRFLFYIVIKCQRIQFFWHFLYFILKGE